ncbi:hypothetical protein TNCV_2342291 [Trichonephila clavipes]|nr:hypothetical protein TNCV_2342291 [Trichonephila clavipes]
MELSNRQSTPGFSTSSYLTLGFLTWGYWTIPIGRTTVPKSKFQITKCRNKENHITDEANIKATPRTARTLKDTLTVFRKHAKKPTAHLLLLA